MNDDIMLSILHDLIAFDTVSSRSNLALIEYVADRLDGRLTEVQLIKDNSGKKANLFATLGPTSSNGGIVLSGHTDVVPVEGQHWSTDPFTMVERDERLYGRGSCDMKGFIAAAMTAALHYDVDRLARPLHLCFSYDEEVGCLGAQKLIQAMADWDFQPSAVIVGEPTMMKVIEGHKGCCEYTTTFAGLAGHGSQPDAGVNAIEYAVRYISELMQLRDDLRARAPTDSLFAPPYTTLQIGKIRGGQAHNIIPWMCDVEWEMRPVQPSDADYIHDHIERYCERTLLPAMRAIYPEASITTKTIGDVVGLTPTTDNEAKAIAQALLDDDQSDVVAFGTEAGLFQRLGLSAVVCGPGSIAQAHKPDEYVSLDQLQQCLMMLEKLEAKLR